MYGEVLCRNNDIIDYPIYTVKIHNLYNVSVLKDTVHIGCQTFKLKDILTKSKKLARQFNISEKDRKLYKSIVKLGVLYYETFK